MLIRHFEVKYLSKFALVSRPVLNCASFSRIFHNVQLKLDDRFKRDYVTVVHTLFQDIPAERKLKSIPPSLCPLVTTSELQNAFS